MLAAHVAELVELLATARSQLDRTLQLAHGVLPSPLGVPERLPLPAGAPVADTAALRQNLVLKRPVFVTALGKAVLRRHTRSRLAAQLGEKAHELLDAYRPQVRQWFRQSLAELRKSFAAGAGFCRLQLERRESAVAAATDVSSLKADLRLLKEWELGAAGAGHEVCT